MRSSVISLVLGFGFTAGGALAQDAEAVAAACTRGSNLPPEICACVGRAAAADLTGDQRGFLIAAFDQDAPETLRLRLAMPATDLIEAATFMAHAPSNCVRG